MIIELPRLATTVPIFRSLFAAALLSGAAIPARAAMAADEPPECSSPQPAGLSIACLDLAAINAAAEEMVASGQTPGLALAVLHRGRFVVRKGYGLANLETQTPVTTQTVFPIYSIAKTFTAAGIMLLVESGKLGLDDRLSRHLKGFPRGDEVTVRQLLNHTSGIKDYATPDFAYNLTGISPPRLVDYIARQKPAFNFSPGTAWQYSNSNYALLGAIIEKVSGQPYRDYMAAQVFARAGLTKTAVDRNNEVVAGRAAGYMRDPASPGGPFVHGIYVDQSVVYAAGGLRSTVEDLATWFTALYAGRVVGKASLELMLAPARVKDGRLAGDAVHEGKAGSFGYSGLGVGNSTEYGRRAIGSGGAFPSFSSIARYFPDDDLLIVATANTATAANYMEWKAGRIIFDQATAAAGKSGN